MNSDRTSMRRTLTAHVLTVAATLLAVAVFFHGRLGLMGKPPVAQIPVLIQDPEPPKPVPVPRNLEQFAPKVPVPDARTPAPAGRRAQGSRSRGAEQRSGLRHGQQERRQHHDRIGRSSGFFGDETSTGTGSGFVIDKQGHVMTNSHVIQASAGAVRVTLFDGSAHPAKSSARMPPMTLPCY